MVEGIMFGCRTLWREHATTNQASTRRIETEVAMDIHLFSVFVPLEREDDSLTAEKKVYLAWAKECDRYGFSEKAERYRKKAKELD